MAAVVGCGATTPAPATTEVTNDGAEPRRLVRVEPVPNVPEPFELTFKQRFATKFENTVLEVGDRNLDLPTLVATGRMTATPTIVFQVDEAHVLDDVVDASVLAPLRAQVERLKGWRATWDLAPNGAHSNIALPSELSQFLPDALPSPWIFPDRPIGVGAKWQELSTITSSKIRWERTATYELRALDDSTATLAVQVEMRAASQAVNVEPNSTTRLNSGKTVSVIDVQVPLRGLVVTGSARALTDLEYTIVRGKQRIRSTTQIETLYAMKRP